MAGTLRKLPENSYLLHLHMQQDYLNITTEAKYRNELEAEVLIGLHNPGLETSVHSVSWLTFF